MFIVQDLHMVELEDFKYGGTNITAFRLVDPNDELVQVMMILMLMLMVMMTVMMLMMMLMTMLKGTGEWEVEVEEDLQQGETCKARW